MKNTRRTKDRDDWANKYLNLIKKTAQHTGEFTAELVKEAYSRARFGPPDSPQSIAPCFRRAIKNKWIIHTGRFQKSANGAPQPIYQSQIFINKNQGEKQNEK